MMVNLKKLPTLMKFYPTTTEMKKYLGFHVDRGEIPFSTEEPCYDAITDEEDEEN
jgi:hypothetical protein